MHFAYNFAYATTVYAQAFEKEWHLNTVTKPQWAEMAHSAERLATDWTVRVSKPGEGEIFATRTDRSWGPPSLLYDEYLVSFPGIKRPGCNVNYPPLFSTEVKERVEL